MIKSFQIGRIPFLVCCPFFHLEQGESQFQFLNGSPANCNQRLSEAMIHGAPSSSIEYAKNPDDYIISPQYCTSSRHSIGSVLLFSQVPWNEIKNVEISSQSETSVCLLDILFQIWRGQPSNFTKNQESPSESKLLIGDQALNEQFQNPLNDQGEPLWKYQYDLAELWYEWQKLPFVFGLWIFRKEKTNEAKIWHKQLHKNIESFEKSPQEVTKKWLENYPCSLPVELWEGYFDKINYRLSDQALLGLTRFYEYACELGYISESPELNFLPLDT